MPLWIPCKSREVQEYITSAFDIPIPFCFCCLGQLTDCSATTGARLLPLSELGSVGLIFSASPRLLDFDPWPPLKQIGASWLQVSDGEPSLTISAFPWPCAMTNGVPLPVPSSLASNPSARKEWATTSPMNPVVWFAPTLRVSEVSQAIIPPPFPSLGSG